ncbi:MAG: nucleoside monophosphate kinase [Candidatus Cloacimonetes bacterium]|nr:nucleoside monophosphate kinase [Candidatus Cloacimonadota bacterium]
MNVVFMGVQGSGKGTQAERIAQLTGWKHINIGQLFREQLSTDSELSREVKNYVLKGELVPDEITFKVIDSARSGNTEGMIFDGFPRTGEQAEYLIKNSHIDGIIVLELPEEESLRRLTSRRNCSKCQANYNLLFKPPKVEGICDKCGGKLVARADDSLPEIKRRIEIYNEQENSILKVCEAHHVPIIRINGKQSIEQIFEEIRNALEELEQ